MGSYSQKQRKLGSMSFVVTMDSNMVHQQNIGKYNTAVVALRARSNRLADTRPMMPALLDLMPQLKAGIVTFLPVS